MTSSTLPRDSAPLTPLEASRALIRLDTTSAAGNLPVVEALRTMLHTAGVTTHVFREDDGKNANLVAVLPAAGEDAGESTDRLSHEVLGDTYGVGRGGVDRLHGEAFAERAAENAEDSARGVLIAGHADCVPTTDQTWVSDPFEPTVRDGKLYGRGACDMKAYLATFASLADRFVSTELSEPVYFAVTWDEEVSCDGARELVKQLDYLGIHPRIAYVGEPTSMEVITAHKSMNAMNVIFDGVAAHSSLLPQGLNAIRYAAEFTQWFHTEIIDEAIAHGPFDEAFVVPHLTGGVNSIQGGIAANTVPAHARLIVEFRALPHADAIAIARTIETKVQQLDAAMKSAVPANPADPQQASRVGAHLEIRTLLYPLDAGADGDAVAFARNLGRPVSPTKVTYGTEAGIFEAAGMSAVVIGPGDIAQAHGANEFVPLEQIDACEQFFLGIRERLSA